MKKLLTNGLLALAAMLWLVGSATANEARIVVRSSATIQESIVTLGDIAEITTTDETLRSGLVAMQLTPAPSGDRTLSITINHIRDILTARGYNATAIQITGASRSEVRRQPGFSENVAAEASPKANQSNMASVPSVVAPATAHLPLIGRGTRAKTQRDSQVQPLGSAKINPSTEDKALHTTRNLRRGEILRVEDLEVRPVTAVRRDDHYPTDLSALVGKELTHALAMDRPVGFDDVRQPILIRRNEIVTVISRAGNVTVRREVISRGEAGQGEPLDVEPLTPKRSGRTRHSDLFRVIVTGPGEAQVLADSAQASTPNR